jgi:hypothetical protein
MTAKIEIVFESGVEIDVPLNKLRKSPRNARKVPHGEAAIEALASSIGAKRMLQPLIVEPETGEDGQPTGFYLVPIGEGRRLAAVDLTFGVDAPFLGVVVPDEGLAQRAPFAANLDAPASGFFFEDRGHFLRANPVQ